MVVALTELQIGRPQMLSMPCFGPKEGLARANRRNPPFVVEGQRTSLLLTGGAERNCRRCKFSIGNIASKRIKIVLYS